jgi:biopolymer transport protein ExbB
MIDAFAALEAAGPQVDAAILSGGVWTALLTTAFGLGVAMPTVAALAWFERRIERVERAVDSALAGAFGIDLSDAGAALTNRRDAPEGSDAGPRLRSA